MRRILPFIITGLIAVSARAQLPDGNTHPELHWYTFNTPHFKIIYHQGLEEPAVRSAAIAESLYTPTMRNMGLYSDHRTSLVLYGGDDISNGLANPLSHTLFIWARSPVKETTGPIKWLPRVTGHEFAHMATFYRSRNFLGTAWELLTLGLTPAWYLEGIAQFESESWDAHRNLLLRSALSSQSTLPLKKMDGLAGLNTLESRLVYEQGHGLTRYIAATYGPDRAYKLAHEHAQFPFSHTWTMKRVLGASARPVFRAWHSDLENIQAFNSRIHESANEAGTRIPLPLDAVAGVRYSHSGQIAVVGIDRWDEGVQRLYIHSGKNQLHSLGGPCVGAYFSWSPDEKEIVVSRRHRNRFGSIINDLYVISMKTKREERITDNLHATDPSWSPVGSDICFVRYERDRSNLWIINRRNGETRRLTDFKAHWEVFAPSWSPDGKHIIFSLFDKKGYRDIAIIDRDGTGFRRLTRDITDDRTPVWSADGEWIVFCRYEAGAPNLHRIRPDGTGCVCLTDAEGGYFNPVWTPGGDSLTAVCFEDRKKVSAYKIPANRTMLYPVGGLKPVWASVRPRHPQDSKTTILSDISARPYRSVSHIRPLLTLPYIGRDDGGVQLGLIHYAADPLNKHQILGYVTARKRIDWKIEYTNAQWFPLLSVSAWSSTSDRGCFLGSDQTLWDRKTGIQATGTLPLYPRESLLSGHWISFWTRFEKADIMDSEQFRIFKTPYQPYSGWINSIGAGYSWLWAKPDAAYDLHPLTGVVFQLSMARSDKILGSGIQRSRTASQIIFRQEMPWARHVSAVKLNTFLQWGDQPVQERLSISSPKHIRALSVSGEGDRFFYGTFEYRIPGHEIGLHLPVFYFERWATALWIDWGKAWGRDLSTYETGIRRKFGETGLLVTAGIEFRNRIILLGLLPVVIRCGYGRDMQTGKNNGYWLIGNVF